MWKLIKVLFVGLVFSMFYFPFEFTFLPGYNTKKILAAVGCFIVLYKCVTTGRSKLPNTILLTIVFSALVSIVGIISNVYNNTPDYVYATYTVSMLVWLSAAYTVVSIIRQAHDTISVKLVVDYLVAVCVFQCVMAQLIDSIPSLKLFIDTYIEQGQVFLNEVNRIYGIGANLDVAGSRFTVAIILIVCMLTMPHPLDTISELIYILSFLLIVVLGSIIARTTYVGVIVSLIYLLISGRLFSLRICSRNIKILTILLFTLAITIPLLINLYNSGGQFQKMLRFAFEGFFNLAENGEWFVASNERLKTMYVFPDNITTWIIGDGYFNNPVNVDPFYVGEITGGYYKGTDVGYLRFIFYFGIIGLITFMTFFIKVTQYCIESLPYYKRIFVLLLMANFVIWFKVSTDIFLIFALFLCVGNMQDDPQQLETES